MIHALRPSWFDGSQVEPETASLNQQLEAETEKLPELPELGVAGHRAQRQTMYGPENWAKHFEDIETFASPPLSLS